MKCDWVWANWFETLNTHTYSLDQIEVPMSYSPIKEIGVLKIELQTSCWVINIVKHLSWLQTTIQIKEGLKFQSTLVSL